MRSSKVAARDFNARRAWARNRPRASLATLDHSAINDRSLAHPRIALGWRHRVMLEKHRRAVDAGAADPEMPGDLRRSQTFCFQCGDGLRLD